MDNIIAKHNSKDFYAVDIAQKENRLSTPERSFVQLNLSTSW